MLKNCKYNKILFSHLTKIYKKNSSIVFSYVEKIRKANRVFCHVNKIEKSSRFFSHIKQELCSQAESFLTLYKYLFQKGKGRGVFFLTLEKLPAWLTLMCCDVNKSQINQFIFQPMPEEKEIFLHKCLMA